MFIHNGNLWMEAQNAIDEKSNQATGYWDYETPILHEFDAISGDLDRSVELNREASHHIIWDMFVHDAKIYAIAGTGPDSNYLDGIIPRIEWWFYEVDPITGDLSKIPSEVLLNLWPNSPPQILDDTLFLVNDIDGKVEITAIDLSTFQLSWFKVF